MSKTRYIQPKQAAETLDYPLPSFYRLIRENRVPGVVRLGPKSIRIDGSKFNEWIEKGGVQLKAGEGAP